MNYLLQEDFSPWTLQSALSESSAFKGGSSPWGFFLFTFVAIFLIYVGGVFLGVLPPSHLSTQFLQLITHWAQQVGL